jgi:hypothetical protein
VGDLLGLRELSLAFEQPFFGRSRFSRVKSAVRSATVCSISSLRNSKRACRSATSHISLRLFRMEIIRNDTSKITHPACSNERRMGAESTP